MPWQHLVSVFMPALLPSCSYTVWSWTTSSSSGRNLQEYSLDRSQCRWSYQVQTMDPTVPNAHNSRCEASIIKPLLLKPNVSYPSDDFPKFPHYKLPIQLCPPMSVCRLVAYKAYELWLISFTIYSVTLIIVYFDQELWEKLSWVGWRQIWHSKYSKICQPNYASTK